MRPTDLEPLESFALLGPGFGHGRARLLTGLGQGDSGPRLVYCGFEDDPRHPTVLRSARCEEIQLEAEPHRPLAISLPEDDYREAVCAIREAIAAGDVYQVCHTLRAPLLGEGLGGADVLAAMSRAGLARFAAWVRLPSGLEFVSSSPELFFEVRGAHVRSEPMKGTAARADAAALEASEKDRCELAMITDLVRNDLTPLCEPRSIDVPHERRVLELAYALQTVSDVTGRLAAGNGPLEVLAALHPGGSVTGAPKRAALEMIGRLEATPRGPYCGALGLWEGDEATFSLLIRTATRGPAGWTYGVGSGVVFDSDPDRELEELRTKLGALACTTRC